jgi:hypothetical protein
MMNNSNAVLAILALCCAITNSVFFQTHKINEHAYAANVVAVV